MWPYVVFSEVIVYCSRNSFKSRWKALATGSLQYVLWSIYTVGIGLTQYSELKNTWRQLIRPVDVYVTFKGKYIEIKCRRREFPLKTFYKPFGCIRHDAKCYAWVMLVFKIVCGSMTAQLKLKDLAFLPKMCQLSYIYIYARACFCVNINIIHLCFVSI